MNIEKVEYFFEGAEKLLEIWFECESNENAVTSSLRKIPRFELDRAMNVACCHILHHRNNEKLDSYVLSESSMFISDNRLILKTCGQTRLLDVLPVILELAKRYANLNIISNFYYSRKNFLQPNAQPSPHQCFDDEVAQLSILFPHGEAFCMGPLNTSDRWYLFVAYGGDLHDTLPTEEGMTNVSSPTTTPTHIDHTLEVQMTQIPANILNRYTQSYCDSGKECTRVSGLAQCVPLGTSIHEELFEPVGYSMNGLVGNTDQYVTVHVTPENDFCYASFETNQHCQCLYKQTLKVLECFKPQKFMMTLFSNNNSTNGQNSQSQLWTDEVPGYRRSTVQFLRLEYDTVIYAQFVRRSTADELIEAIRRSVSNVNNNNNNDDDDGDEDDDDDDDGQKSHGSDV